MNIWISLRISGDAVDAVNAPAVFQNFMHKVLRDFLHWFVIVYINDILIFSKSESEHWQHVTRVLKRLRDFYLYLKAEKCSFHQSSVQYLGYIINRRYLPLPPGLNPLPSRSCNIYKKFIKNYSITASPLTSLLRGKPKALH